MSSEGKVSFKLKRFAGIKRDYTPEEVERLKGSITGFIGSLLLNDHIKVHLN